jgi:thymidylate synthase (FAD)
MTKTQRCLPDPYFCVELLSRTIDPQTLVWQAMHQDYSEHLVATEEQPSEPEAGEIAVRHLLKGGRGHYGPLEGPSITFNVGYFPHSVMQQARTHRVGISFDVQSMRYTGKRISAAATGEVDLEEVFYLRPVGNYTDRKGNKYTYTEQDRLKDLEYCEDAADLYHSRVSRNFAEEHARGLLPFDYRQHFVITFNMRSLMHFLDLRAKANAQYEIHQMCNLLLPHFESWAPEIYSWYTQNRLGRALLAP